MFTDPGVRFVHVFTAGGSVKFLPAVQISPETTRFTIKMKVRSTFYPDFISKPVDLLIISYFITRVPKLLMFEAFMQLIREKKCRKLRTFAV